MSDNAAPAGGAAAPAGATDAGAASSPELTPEHHGSLPSRARRHFKEPAETKPAATDAAKTEAKASDTGKESAKASGDKGEADTDAAAEAKAEAKAEAAAEKRRILKLKVDGGEEEFDATDDATLVRELQKARAADKRLQEAAHVRKVTEYITQTLRTDPLKILTDPRFGIDPKIAQAAAEQLVRKQIDQEMMTPEQKAAAERDAELERYRSAEKARKEQEAAQEVARLEAKHAADYTAKFTAALNACGLPATPMTLRRIAVYQRYCNENKIPATAEQIAAKVREDYLDEHQALFGSLDGDKLLEHFGPSIAKAREADLRKHRPRNPDGTFQGAGGGAPAASAPARRDSGEPKVLKRGQFLRDLKKNS